MREMVGGCCVCSDERGWAENPLVYCDGHGCSVAVHQGNVLAAVGASIGGQLSRLEAARGCWWGALLSGFIAAYVRA